MPGASGEVILLAATNLKDILEHASLRRFHFKVGFDYLTPEWNIIFYRRLLQGLTGKPLTRRYREYLREMSYLTPGDFYAVKNQFGFHAGEQLTHEVLIGSLKGEVSLKRQNQRAIGF